MTKRSLALVNIRFRTRRKIQFRERLQPGTDADKRLQPGTDAEPGTDADGPGTDSRLKHSLVRLRKNNFFFHISFTYPGNISEMNSSKCNFANVRE